MEGLIPLQLAHIDLCGIMQSKSLGMSSYFLSFSDDFSRMCSKIKMRHLDVLKNSKNLLKMRVNTP